mmetsp:Transcript_28424/g.20533  ORF Transcript_28424/g.20533 Transcript_28424/m.20533 type:complete len:223 (-) Transcript_28424:87-755(-)|eukprot:CAMPEP_0116870616 /NCGR_PEP_ID=MMETSP0463-20121206/595_1 /TAXON_ID=181622 /ORGANISM="Strombidinopsis sp, Strain SopsisLIS2011" /LENGTH=222 /DNA_ID=CAMNT_0004507473 /DNA_START=1015 /DNA_END=1683 /DNA_ORIENTATION=+
MVSGSKAVCANCGDSRAVLGSLRPPSYRLGKDEAKTLVIEDNDHFWVVKPLSEDHKADLPEETRRILASNGRIEHYKGARGEDVGPARVWLKHDQYPGLAMSRSIGDSCAHSIGVSPMPETKEFDLDQDSKLLVIATDGVWEFISSEDAIDLLIPYWHADNIQGACEALVKESVASWAREEESCDDISCIIVFLKVPEKINNDNKTTRTTPRVGSASASRSN